MLVVVLLAMVAAFLALRLYSVLGKRTGHEQPLPKPAEERFPPSSLPRQVETPVEPRDAGARVFSDGAERGVRALIAADPSFDVAQFLDGAKGAYRMVLEAFWNGDRETMRELCDDDVYAGFVGAIDAREAAGETLANSLIRIEEVRVHSASLDGRMARIALLFVADIAAVTRDKDGNVIAGSLDDAVESRDVWTFSRNVSARDPNWLLDETDEG